MTAPVPSSPSCPAALAGLFGAALADAAARDMRLLIEPVPGVVIPVLPTFYALPADRVLAQLMMMLRTAARQAGIPLPETFSGDATLQAAPLSARGAAGGDPRQQPAEARSAGCILLRFPRGRK